MDIVSVESMDVYFMGQALKIAKYAAGRVSPNPLVGAVIVKDGRIVGQGWHLKAGTAHAEINALKQAGDLAKGAVIYVTLEPCCHYGRTGPCTQALIKGGVKTAVIAMRDPNPLVAGKGLAALREAGIKVREGVLAEEARKMNEPFIKWITTGQPFIALKTAMSLDGKIACHTGDSKWITSAQARGFVHKLRDCHDAILIGVGTALKDNPSLTTRLKTSEGAGKNPIRIIVDSLARLSLNSNVLNDGLAETIVAVSQNAPKDKVSAFKNKGAKILTVPTRENGLDLGELLKMLGKRNITSVFVEGGSLVNASLFRNNLVDKLYWFIAPKIIGGDNAKSPVGGIGAPTVDAAVGLCNLEFEKIGEDILVSADVLKTEGT